MVEAVEILDALQARAYTFQIADDDICNWVKDFQASPRPADNKDHSDLLSTENIVNTAESQKVEGQPPRNATAGTKTNVRSDSEVEDTDLIDFELRA